MWHKHNCLENINVLSPEDPFKDKVKCETCKCWVDKNDAQQQKLLGMLGGYNLYYCQAHKKPYDRMITCFPDNLYFKEVRVDKNGEPYGYAKVKEKEKDAKN